MNGTGSIVILASPSGGGKTSLVGALCQKDPKLTVSTSHTTRQRRPDEVDGKDYYFVDEAIFEEMVQAGAFLEHANVFGQQYGTSKEQIVDRITQGLDVLLDIDWQGARQLKDHFDDVISIFILPPSQSSLKARLMERQQDDEETVNFRMAKSYAELTHYDEFDYLVVNDIFENALSDIYTIIAANRLKSSRQRQGLSELLSKLLSKS